MNDASRPPALSLEQELKLRLAAGVALPPVDIADITVVSRGVTTLQAVYHDTHDARLTRWGITLRRRSGGADEGWHLKLSDTGTGAMSVREELHLPLAAGGPQEAPAEFRQLLRALTREAPLVPLAQTRTRRRTWELRTPQDEPVLLLTDDVVTTERETFREVEIELVPGPDGEVHPRAAEVLDQLATTLHEAGATPSPGSKGAQALGPVATGPADVVVPAATSRPTAAEVLHRSIATHVRALLAADLMLRRRQRPGVHRFRVAARRLRSLLRTFADVLDPGWSRELRAELGWVAGAFGEARDGEVQRDRLLAHLEELAAPLADELREVVAPLLAQRQALALDHALALLDTDRYQDLLVRLVAAARQPRMTKRGGRRATAVLTPAVSRAVARVLASTKGLRPGRGARRWHRARLRAKRARYGADVLALAGSQAGKKLARRLSHLTDALGAAQDAAVARALLRELSSAPGLTAQQGFALGLLDGIEADRQRAAQARALAARARVQALS